jgi:hypothetical protein
MTLIDNIEKKNGRWHSLTQFKDFIKDNSKEKIKHFDGVTLTTNKYTYRLCDGIITWTN